MKLCRNFHIATEAGQGPRPIVPHCCGSGPASTQCEYAISDSKYKQGLTCVEDAVIMTPVGEVSDVETPPELRTFTGSVIDPAGIVRPANDTYNNQIVKDRGALSLNGDLGFEA